MCQFFHIIILIPEVFALYSTGSCFNGRWQRRFSRDSQISHARKDHYLKILMIQICNCCCSNSGVSTNNTIVLTNHCEAHDHSWHRWHSSCHSVAKLISYRLERHHHLVGNRTELKIWSFCLPLILGWYPFIKCNGGWKTAVSSYMPPSWQVSPRGRFFRSKIRELLERQISNSWSPTKKK